MPNIPNKPRMIDVRHPYYVNDSLSWNEWRETYEGGEQYIRTYLNKYSDREDENDFQDRRKITPAPTYAKAAINDIRNSIFQRLNDVTRRNGSTAYMSAMAGNLGGVDNKGASMQSFMGITVLTELLVMGRVGVYIDSPELTGNSLADVGDHRPYLYHYPAENILSWVPSKPGQPGDFQSLLLRDTGVTMQHEMQYGIIMPGAPYTRYRLIWIDEVTGKVHMVFYDEKDHNINKYGQPSLAEDVITLDMDRIPFTLLDIGSSLLKDVSNHQKALLNLGSSDVSYALKANFPFFIEQKDLRAVGAHLKDFILEDGTPSTSENDHSGREANVGVTRGKAYDLKAEPPAFIHPSSEPLLASMKLQEKLEDDIRKLVNLAVQNKQGQRVTSAEALKLSDQGLEAGLSYIGLVLEGAERQIAEHWAAYEQRDHRKRQIALIRYPDRYSLKDDTDRIEEADKLSDLMDTVPGVTVKKEVAKTIASTLLDGRVDVAKMEKIFKEIDAADYTTSDPDVTIRAQEAGLVDDETASQALGYRKGTVEKAKKDHADRALRILQAQTSAKDDMADAGARGVGDLATEKGGQAERDEATETTLKADAKKPQRGKGKSLAKGDE